MKDEADDIMNIYSEKCSKIHIPNQEQEFQMKCQNEKQGLLEKYFTRKPTGDQTPTQQYVPQQEQPQQQVLNEAQQRNMFLNEAAIKLATVMPMFRDKRDREYLKEIREAIEEMME